MKIIFQYIARQFSRPTGFGGRISTFLMNRMNRLQYRCIAENINLSPSDTVLDIGFGNGYMIRQLAKKQPAKIFGIDISPDMLQLAEKRCKRLIESGKAELLQADISALPFENESVDKAYTLNTVYFWQNAAACFVETARVLKSGGMFVHVLYSKKWLDKLPITQYGFSKYTVEEISIMTESAGLKIVKTFEIEKDKSLCVIAEKQRLSYNIKTVIK